MKQTYWRKNYFERTPWKLLLFWGLKISMRLKTKRSMNIFRNTKEWFQKTTTCGVDFT